VGVWHTSRVKIHRFVAPAVLFGASVAGAETARDVAAPETPPGYGIAAWADPTSPPVSSGLALEEHPEAHVVALERNGRRVGVGAVLATGHVLSSLTGVGSGRNLAASFNHGARVPVRVVSTHRGFDLALLAFEIDAPNAGLQLSNLEEPDRALVFRAGVPGSRRFAGSRAAQVIGGDAVELEGALVPTRTLPLGTPVVDSLGRLVGMSVQGCVARPSSDACVERDVVVPVSFLRQFLHGADAADATAWLGAGVEFYDAGWLRGLRVVSLEPGSPAQAASLEVAAPGREGDLLVAMNGMPIGTPRRLQEMLANHVPGSQVDLLLLRGGMFRHVIVRLGAQRRAGDQWQLNPPLIQPPSPWLGF
jgi:S1-C subfamily serine protease